MRCNTPREHCLVLPAGGPAGVAHLGAIEALREARVPIACVVGTSMGAVVGALYASSPQADTTARVDGRSFQFRTVPSVLEPAEDVGGRDTLDGLDECLGESVERPSGLRPEGSLDLRAAVLDGRHVG